MVDNSSNFDNLETHYNCILAWYDSDFGESYPNKEKFDNLISNTKKNDKITNKDISNLKKLVEKFQDDFIVKWCGSLANVINKRKIKTQDFSDIECELDNLKKYVKENNMDKKTFREKYDKIKTNVKKINSRLNIESNQNRMFWKGIWYGAVVGFILGIIGGFLLWKLGFA